MLPAIRTAMRRLLATALPAMLVVACASGGGGPVQTPAVAPAVPIAAVLTTGARRPVVHLTGAFHTDHGDGIPVRLLRRLPAAETISITLVPVADLDEADPAPHLERADFLLFTLER